jgi:putative hydroxymethylpyrimidine transporter CytX
MVLLRAPLGRRGSYAPTVLNVAQNLGWSTFELIIISSAAAALSDRVFGFRERWLWALVFGAISLALGLMGPIGFVRRYLRKFAVWAVLASIVYLTWWVLDKADLGALWDQPGEGGVTLGQGIDLVIANIVSWTPLAADYTRFARNRRGAFWGAGVGYLLPSVWCLGIGTLLVLSRDLSEPTQIPNVVATGSVLAVVALLMLTVDESDEAFADIYSTAVSIQNVLPGMSQRLLIVLVAATATLGAIVIDLGNYLTFLYLLGSVFVPLFAVLLADWLVRGAHYAERDIFDAPRLRWEPLVAWFAGFALYQWLSPVGPSWWTDVVEHTSPGHPRLTASLPSFALAFGLTLLAAWVDSRRAAARSRREPLARPR